jgi:hypothetical protein
VSSTTEKSVIVSTFVVPSAVVKVKMSLPEPPVRVSLPSLPLRTLLPALPGRLSAKLLPVGIQTVGRE